MASIQSIYRDVLTIGMPSITKQILLDLLKSAGDVVVKGKVQSDEDEKSSLELSATKLGEGGWNEVFLISSSSNAPKPLVLRLPKPDSLLPYQVINEVGCASMIALRGIDIPVPKVYSFAANSPNPFIVQEYIDGEPLSNMWNRYTEDEKEEVAHNIAEIVVKMGEVRFDGIGGFTGGAENLLGPTVEGSKIFKGRNKFHSSECYHIGPYKNTKEYVLACYDKEIYYYTHAPASDIDSDFFEDISVEKFVQQLRDKRQFLETSYVARDEPFVLVHEDLNGRNIMMQGTKVQAVLDWEFSGAYPLSELADTGVYVLEMTDEESVDECSEWSGIILDMVEEVARERGWPEKEVALLVGGGDPVVGSVRGEMFPDPRRDED